MENQQSNLKLPGVIRLLKDSYLVYRLRFKTIFGIVLIYCAQVVLFSVLLVISGALGFVFLTIVKSSLPILIVAVVVGVIAVLLAIFIQNWTILALIASVVFYREGIGIKESFARSRKKVFSYMWLSFLITGVVAMGSIFFIIPGIVLFIWYFLSSFILIAENTGSTDALLKSREYVRGKFFPVLVRLLFITAFVLLFQLTINITNQVFSKVGFPIIGLVVAVLSLIIVPLGFIYVFLLYDNLKALRGDFVLAASHKSKIIIFTLVTLLPFILILLSLGLIAFGPKPTSLKNQSPSKTRVTPYQATKLNQIFVAPDKTWSIEYDSAKTQMKDVTTWGNNLAYYFENTVTPCKIDLLVYIFENPSSLTLENFIASDSSRFGEKQEDIIQPRGVASSLYFTNSTKRYLIGEEKKAIQHTETDKSIYYSFPIQNKIISLNYIKIIKSTDPLSIINTYPQNCVDSEEYINKMIYSFKLL